LLQLLLLTKTVKSLAGKKNCITFKEL